MIEITVPDYNDSSVEVDLDDEIFFFHFSWNSTGEFWTLAIENAYNDELVSNLKLLPNRSLFNFVRLADLPLGELVVVRDDKQEYIKRDDFKNGVASLVYLSVDEV